jgi:peptide/nickel transport system substrate-binding protein
VGAELGVGQLANVLTLEGLTQLGVEGRALPRLAKSWSWESDELSLRLKLREDVVLHDGRPLDSQLAAEAIAIAVAKMQNLASYPALRDLTAARPDGPFDLVLDLSARSSLLPEDLTVLLDIPAGPYRRVNRADKTIELERFDRYYLGTPSIPRVLMTPFDTLRNTWASLLRREVDMVSDVPADAVEFIRSEDVQVLPFKRWYQYLIMFNSRSGPLQSPQVRRALNIAIDRETLIRDVLRGSGSPSYGPLWPQYWAYDSSAAMPAFDPELAIALLEGAGFSMSPGSDERPAARLRFICLIPENFSVWERIALKVQKDLFNIGVDMQIKVVSFNDFNGLMGKGQFEAAILDSISGPTPGRAYIFWASRKQFKGVYNVFGYENPESERLFGILRTTRNEAAVRSATGRLQRILLDDPPALFLAWNERARAVGRDVVVPDEAGRDPFLSLWQWQRRSDTLAANTAD